MHPKVDCLEYGTINETQFNVKREITQVYIKRSYLCKIVFAFTLIVV